MQRTNSFVTIVVLLELTLFVFVADADGDLGGAEGKEVDWTNTSKGMTDRFEKETWDGAGGGGGVFPIPQRVQLFQQNGRNWTGTEVMRFLREARHIVVISRWLTMRRPNMGPVLTWIHWLRGASRAGHNLTIHSAACPGNILKCLAGLNPAEVDLIILVGTALRGRPQRSEIDSMLALRRTIQAPRSRWRRKSPSVSTFPPLVLVVTGDEWCEWTHNSIRHPRVVLKVYHHPHVLKTCRNVRWIPLGFSHQFVPPVWTEGASDSSSSLMTDSMPITQRHVLVCLIASLATSLERAALAKVLTRHKTEFPEGSVYVHMMAKWSGTSNKADHYLSPVAYRTLLTRSLFTVVPAGHNGETFRLWESLECGSIPLMLAGHQHSCGIYHFVYHRSVNGLPSPLIVLANVSEVIPFLRFAMSHRTEWEEHSRYLRQWYGAFKDEVYGSILQLVLATGTK